jgi:apolipoprotein N-acyltransferase
LSRRRRTRGRVAPAWAGGAGYFALTLHWIVEPFMVDAARHGWMAPFALVLFAGGLALFWAVAGWAAVRRGPGHPRALAFAPLLTLFEAARGTVLTGFPWAFPGHALIDTPWLRCPHSPGAHGLTFWWPAIAVRFGPAAFLSRASGPPPWRPWRFCSCLCLPFSHAPAAAPTHPLCA